ncbi:hypothetical protein DFH06DRAFT_1415499 [Mycena polygramma]|nr:hypothetical protein DFH06DRAFT_1415499 [Mycena polygramma]
MEWGKPFVRAYSPALESYGISQAEFLHFIDELNIQKRGNLSWHKLMTVGDIVGKAGDFDPTQIINIVGMSLQCVDFAALWNSACGPYANKRVYLRKANRELFEPKGLKASLSSAPELRQRLGMEPDADLALPIEHSRMCAMPTKEELGDGQQAPIRAAHRQILALEGRVTGADVAAELGEAWRTERDAGVLAAGRKWAGKEIHKWHTEHAIKEEKARHKAIKLRDKALAKSNEAKRQKGLKAGARTATGGW